MGWPVNATQPETRIARVFLRCISCLNVWCADVEVRVALVPGSWASRARLHEAARPVALAGCPLDCGTPHEPEIMGERTGERVTRNDGAVCECDASCAFARGPKCDCKCNGYNHGAGVLAYRWSFSDQGATVNILKRKPASVATARARRLEWEAALAEARDAVGAAHMEWVALSDRKQKVGWLTREEFDRMRSLSFGGDLVEVQQMKTHAGRMKNAAALRDRARAAANGGT